MRYLSVFTAALALSFLALVGRANADTLDWRDCTPHSAEEAAAYRDWLIQFFDPEDYDEMDELVASFQRGDMMWADQPCPKIAAPPIYYGTPETCAMHAEGKLLGFLEQRLRPEDQDLSPMIVLTLDDGDSLCAPVVYEDIDGTVQVAFTEPAWECGTAEFDLRFLERCE